MSYKNKRRRYKKVNGWLVLASSPLPEATILVEKKTDYHGTFWNPKNAPPEYKTVKGSDFYESDQWKSLRYQAFKKYGNTCACCGRGPKNGAVMHVDHIKPRSLYPQYSLDLDNLQILCRECNVAKWNNDFTDWR